MRIYSFIFLLIASVNCWGQSNIKHLKPKLGQLLTFNDADQRLIERRGELYKIDKLTAAQTKELKLIEERFPEDYGGLWDAVGGGCSWYCGGGPYKITAASSLASQKMVNYKVDNVHDLSYRTVWSEGVVGYGIGEYVEYHFKAESPRITQIQIANGYVKSDKTWLENSRVKALKMYVNGKPYAILDLKDSRALQQFDIPVLGRNNGKKDWVLRFEIADVYKGDKYDDVVISELFFDGVDVH